MNEKITIRIKEKKGAEINRAAVAVLLFLYVIVLLWIIVFKCNVNSQLNIERNLAIPLWERFTRRIIPFMDIYYMFVNKISVWNVLAFFFNTICCIPAGMLLGFFVSKRWGLLLSGIFILGVEVFQLFSGWGGFEPTDIFMNLLGVYIGYIIFDALYKRISDKAINGAVLVCLCIAIPVAVFAVIRTALNFPV